MRRALLVALAALALPSTAAAASKPDLTVSALKLSGTQISGTVKNGGKGKSAKSTLTVSNGKTKLAAITIKALAARKSVTFKATIKPPTAAGSYTLRACADSAKKVKEAKETNNCRAVKLTVVAPVPQPHPAPPAPAPTPNVLGNNTVTPTPTASATTTPAPTPGTEAPAPGPTDAPAPDPVPRATAPVTGETTLIGDSTKFLYTGANPIQTGVAAGTISEQRAAVLRGKVLNRMGGPIAGVRVTVVGHPEYGMTDTRTDGGFDMAVNGGGPLTLRFARAGYIPVQRRWSRRRRTTTSSRRSR